MTLSRILSVLFPIVFISFLGFLFSRARKTDPRFLSDIVIYLTAPALFFVSFYRHHLIMSEFPRIFITISAVMLAVFLAVFALRKFRPVPVGLYLPTVFMNSSFVGFPVVLMAYGPDALTRAIAYDFINGIYIFTVGIFIMSGQKERFELFKLPFFYTSLLGLYLNLSRVHLPAALLTPVEMLGSATIPLALIMLGMRLGEVKIRSLALPLLASFLRIVLGGAAAWLVVTLLKVDPFLSKILIVMSALPSAFMGLVLAEKYGHDQELIASSIALCTLLFALALPLLLWMLP
jgi:malate permease and related proteins